MSTNVHKLLMQARIKLHGLAVKKSGRNTFANYSYMELADFLVPTQTIFAELGLCGVVSFTADLATLTITSIEDGSFITITSPMGSAALKGCHEVQNVGAVETYQRRYLWVAAMEIVEHDALDSGPPAESLEPVLKASIEQAKQKRQGVMAAVLADIKLDAATEAALHKLAAKVAPMPVAAAFDYIEGEALSGDEMTFLWSLLPSNTRSALKRERESRKQTA